MSDYKAGIARIDLAGEIADAAKPGVEQVCDLRGGLGRVVEVAHRQRLAAALGRVNYPRMRRPDKTELEFFLLMVLIGMPFVYYAIKIVLALLRL